MLKFSVIILVIMFLCIGNSCAEKVVGSFTLKNQPPKVNYVKSDGNSLSIEVEDVNGYSDVETVKVEINGKEYTLFFKSGRDDIALYETRLKEVPSEVKVIVTDSANTVDFFVDVKKESVFPTIIGYVVKQNEFTRNVLLGFINNICNLFK